MFNDEVFNFMMEGGDELLNSEECPYCGYVIYLDEKIEWVDKNNNICKCSNCAKELFFKISLDKIKIFVSI